MLKIIYKSNLTRYSRFRNTNTIRLKRLAKTKSALVVFSTGADFVFYLCRVTRATKNLHPLLFEANGCSEFNFC